MRLQRLIGLIIGIVTSNLVDHGGQYFRYQLFTMIQVSASLMKCPVAVGDTPADPAVCTECTTCYTDPANDIHNGAALPAPPQVIGYFQFVDSLLDPYIANIRGYHCLADAGDADRAGGCWTPWAEAPSENHFACGIDTISNDWDFDGVGGMRVKWCHILAWEPDEIDQMYPLGVEYIMETCPVNSYMDAFTVLWDRMDDGAQDTGISMVQYRCTEPEKKTCTGDNDWVQPPAIITNPNPKDWQPVIYGDDQEYICAFRIKAGQQWNWGSASNVDMLGMYDIAVRFCNNRFENIGFKKDEAVMSSSYGFSAPFNYAHNPFKTNQYNYDFWDTDNTCIYTDNTRLGGDYWEVRFDGGLPVQIYSVSLIASNDWDWNTLNGVEVYIDGVLCATISNAVSGSNSFFGFACSGLGSVLRLQQVPGVRLKFCGIMVWKEITAYPTSYADIPITYSVMNPDLSLIYPLTYYDEIITHYSRTHVVDTTPALDYKFVVTPYESTYPISPALLLIDDFITIDTCFPVCSKMNVRLCSDAACASVLAVGADPVSLDQVADQSNPFYDGYSFSDLNLQIKRNWGHAAYSSITYLEYTSEGCYPKTTYAKIKVILCGEEVINQILPFPEQTIYTITPLPTAVGLDLVHRILFENVFNITQSGNINAVEVDCPFKEYKLCLDSVCTWPLNPWGTFTQINRYTDVTSLGVQIGYDFDITTEYGPEIMYVCAFSYGNVRLCVEMSHQVIWRNDYDPGFETDENGDGANFDVVYEVWENDDPQTFEFMFNCISDPDPHDFVTLTYEVDDLPVFGLLEEVVDPECMYGTRWKATFVGITTEEIGTYQIPFTLHDNWDHQSTFVLDVEIKLKPTYAPGFNGDSFSQVYQVAEWWEPQTFVYQFPCINDPDTEIDDQVTATFDGTPVFGRIQEIPDETCQYGTRYKVTFNDVTYQEIGIYQITVTLTDLQLNQANFYLFVHIQEYSVWNQLFPENLEVQDIIITWDQHTSAEIEKVSCDGQLTIRFNRTMDPPLEIRNQTYYREYLAGIDWRVLDIYVLQSEINQQIIISEYIEESPEEEEEEEEAEEDLRFLQVSNNERQPQQNQQSEGQPWEPQWGQNSEQQFLYNAIYLTWNVTEYVGDLMIIDINFTNSDLISLSGSELDNIVFEIKNNETNVPQYFTSEDGHPLVNMTLMSEIPVQECIEDLAEQAGQMAVVLAEGVKMLLLIMIFVRIFGGGSFWQFMTVIQTLQLIVHLPMFNVPFPENVVEYLNGLSPIMTYDFIFSNEWWPKDAVKYDPNIDSSFYQMQYIGYYDRESPLDNLLMLLIVVVCYFAFLVVAFFILVPFKKFASQKLWLTQKAKNTVDVLVFDVIIFITFLCYLEMMVVGMLVFQKETKAYNFDNHAEFHPLQYKVERQEDVDYYQANYTEDATEIVNNGTWTRRNLQIFFEIEQQDEEAAYIGAVVMACYFLLSTLILLPLLILYIISRNMKYYGEKPFLKKWGIGFSDIKTQSKAFERAHIMYILLFILRRVLFLVLVFTLANFICVQIILALFISAGMIWYKSHYKPFNSRFKNCCKIWNEIIIFLATEILIFFTDYFYDWDHHWGAGWIFIYLISIWFFIHTLIMILSTLKWCFLLYLRYKNLYVLPCLRKIQNWWMQLMALCFKQKIIPEDDERKKKRVVIRKKKRRIIRRYGWQNELTAHYWILTWERQPKYFDWEEELILNGRREWYQGKQIIKYIRRTYNGGWRNPLVYQRVLNWERQPRYNSWEEEVVLNGRRQWYQGKLSNYRLEQYWAQKRYRYRYLYKYWQNPLVAEYLVIQWERQTRYNTWEEEVIKNGVREWYQGRPIRNNQFESQNTGSYNINFNIKRNEFKKVQKTVVKRKGWQNPLTTTFMVIDLQRPSTRLPKTKPYTPPQQNTINTTRQTDITTPSSVANIGPISDEEANRMRVNIVNSNMTDEEKKNALYQLIKQMEESKLPKSSSETPKRVNSGNRATRLNQYNVKDRLNSDLPLSQIVEQGIESSRYNDSVQSTKVLQDFGSSKDDDEEYVTVRVKKSQMDKSQQ